MLTIAIPTYNRNAQLLAAVQDVLPQMNDQCRLLILDNCSPEPVQETLRPALEKFPAARVEIRRNRVNIGANNNILRCFELCETPWLWVLGDDDTPAPDAIAIILEHLTLHPECLYFNFAAGGYGGFQGRPQKVFTRGLRDFVQKIELIANVFFISSGVHKASVSNENLRFAYAYAHTQPNFIPLLTSLGEDGVCCLSERQIVTYNPPAPNQQQWSLMYFGLGIMSLLELPMAPDIRQLLARKIRDSIPWLEIYVLQLLMLANREGDNRGALFFYDQLCCRVYYFEVNRKLRAKLRLYRWMLRFPRPSYRMLLRLKRKKPEDYAMENPLERV